MKRSFEKAKKAVERLFWDTCFVETFSEETAAWGESLILLYPAEKEIAAGSAVRILRENGAERRYIAAGESRVFLMHRAVGLRRDETV